MASSTPEQRLRVKEMLVESLAMRIIPSDIADDIILFDLEGLGLDSVDAIEIVAGIEREFGYVFDEEEKARQVFVSIATLADFLASEGKL